MYGSEGTQRRLYQPRRVYVCTECHKSFRNTSDLYQHVEICLLEAFENEALAIFSDTTLKSATQSSSTAPFGIVAKPSGLPPMEGRVEVRLGGGAPSEKEHQRMYNAASASRKEYIEDHDEGEEAGPSSSRMIEGPGGLRLVVTVEKEDVRGGGNGGDEENIEKEAGMSMLDMSGDYIDDEMTIQEEEEEMNAPLIPFPTRRVIGALANSDDEPYKPKMECPTCGLVLYRHNFATHYRIHTGELPFPCSYCEKRFRSTSALKVHTRAHTGEKPYACPSCDYAALTKRNLDRHIINNHVREGERRGPRSRKSKYRDPEGDPISLWTMEALEMEKSGSRAAYDVDKDHQYGRMDDVMEDMDEEVIHYGEEVEMDGQELDQDE